MCDSFVIFGVLPAGLQFLETTFCSLFRSASSPQYPSFVRLNPFPEASSYRPELPLFMCRTARTKHTMQTTNHTIHRRPANPPTRRWSFSPFFALQPPLQGTMRVLGSQMEDGSTLPWHTQTPHQSSSVTQITIDSETRSRFHANNRPPLFVLPLVRHQRFSRVCFPRKKIHSRRSWELFVGTYRFSLVRARTSFRVPEKPRVNNERSVVNFEGHSFRHGGADKTDGQVQAAVR